MSTNVVIKYNLASKLNYSLCSIRYVSTTITSLKTISCVKPNTFLDSISYEKSKSFLKSNTF